MATTTLNGLNSSHAATGPAAPHTLLSDLGQRIHRWRRRSRERFELMHMTDLDLADIGISRADAEMEAVKPFWRA